MRLRRRLAAALALVLTAVAFHLMGGRAAAQDWIAYSRPGFGYSIEFPGQPKISYANVNTTAGPTRLTQVVIETNDAAYIATHVDFAASIISARPLDQHLDNARNGQAKGGRVVSERRIVVSGHPARHVVIEKQGLVIAVRTVLVGRRLFQVLYVSSAEAANSPNQRRFLDSLRIAWQ